MFGQLGDVVAGPRKRTPSDIQHATEQAASSASWHPFDTAAYQLEVSLVTGKSVSRKKLAYMQVAASRPNRRATNMGYATASASQMSGQAVPSWWGRYPINVHSSPANATPAQARRRRTLSSTGTNSTINPQWIPASSALAAASAT